jgi:putative membrane protein
MILNVSIKFLLIGLTAFFAVNYLPGFEVDDLLTLLVVATVVATINALFAPLITWLTFPFTILTISLIVFALNTFSIRLAENFIDGFTVSGWSAALLFSLIVTLVSVGTDKLLLRRSF